MRYLYLDNLRGFKDQLIPFSDINFFVGENSTGKTSVLSIFKALTSRDFLHHGYLMSPRTTEYLGDSFDSLVSVNSENKTSFTAGFGSDIEGDVFFVLFRFIQKDDQPWVSRAIATEGSEIFSLEELSEAGTNDGRPAYNLTVINNKFKKQTKIRTIVNTLNKTINSTNKNVRNPKSSVQFDPIDVFPLNLFFSLHARFLPLELHETGRSTELYENLQGIRRTIFNLPFAATSWSAPIRSKPQSTYTGSLTQFSSEGAHFPFEFRKAFISSKNEFKEYQRKLNHYGKASGLFDSIEVKLYEESLSGPFEINVVLSHNQVNLKHVGYGVSQILPIMHELISRKDHRMFLQQPEVHLHPRAQAAFGEILFEFSKQSEQPLFIETHSDFIIDRFRLCISKDRKYKKNVSVLFFSRDESGNKVSEVKVESDGSYSENQPEEFREFFLNEAINILAI